MVRIGNVELGEFPLWLSPMEDVTHFPFRKICKEHGADVLVTEFVSSDALIRLVPKTLQKMKFSEIERPFAIQIYGHDEASLSKAAELAASYQPDFVDINWGCPMRKIAARGAGSGILKDPPKMINYTRAVVRCLESVKMPVSVKTRLGWEESDKPIVGLAEALQDIGIAALSVHGRTGSQMYKGEADWTLIGKIKENQRMRIPVFGNGDVDTPEKVKEHKERYGVDGILIGRGAIGNPWIFEQSKLYLSGVSYQKPSVAQICGLLKEQLASTIAYLDERRAVQEIKKHYTNYFKGIPDFKSYKIKLMKSSSEKEAYTLMNEIAQMFAETLI